jgi:hypothetical protein
MKYRKVKQVLYGGWYQSKEGRHKVKVRRENLEVLCIHV